MKKISSLCLILLVYVTGSGQINLTPAGVPDQFPQPQQKIDHAEYYQLKNRNSGVAYRSMQTLALDYDAADELEAVENGAVYERFIWDLNTRYDDADTNRFALTWAAVRFDTLTGIDSVYNIFSYSRSSAQIVIDSILFYFTHENISGTPDTILVSVYQWQGPMGLQLGGPQDEIVNPVLYDTMIISTTSLSPGASQLAVAAVYPNLTLSYPNNRFSVGIHFYGDTTNNTFTLLSGYADYCAGQCFARPSVITDNSLYRMIAWAGSNNLTGVNALIYNCDQDSLSGEIAECEVFPIQNFLITPYLTIDGISLITSSTPATTCNAADGSASVIVVGGSGDYSYQWSVPDNDSLATGLPAGTYYVTVTDDSSGLVAIGRVVVTDDCGTISGIVFKDANANGVMDTAESAYSGVRVEINPGGLFTYANQSGNFSVGVQSYDTFTVSVRAPYSYRCNWSYYGQDSVTAPAGGVHTVIIDSLSTIAGGLEFGLTSLSNICGIVSGHVFHDLNSNGVKDAGEMGQSGIYIVSGQGIITVSDYNGNYSFDAPINSSVTVSLYIPAHNSYYCFVQPINYTQTFPTSPATYTVTVTQAQPASSGNDFGVNNVNSVYDAGVYNISPLAGNRAGDQFHVWMDYKTDGIVTDTCRIRLEFNPLVHFVSAMNPPDVVTSSYVEWIYPPGSAPLWYCMQMLFELDSSASAGTLLTWIGTYRCGNGIDLCPSNDMMLRAVMVISGPVKMPANNGLNSMHVFHSGNAQNEITTADSALSYVIYFQNTGTDSVFHMRIIDTLPPYLNAATISRPFSNKPYNFSLPAENVVAWEFDNIALPDSTTDYLNSYGFVQFNIYLNPNVPVATDIENRVAISFNYEVPYFTDKVSVTVIGDVGIGELPAGSLKIYPNPSNGRVTVEMPEALNGETRISVLNLLGATMLERQFENQTKVELNIDKLPAGIYMVRVETEGATRLGKIVVKQ